MTQWIQYPMGRTLRDVAVFYYNQVFADQMVSNRLKYVSVLLREALAAEHLTAWGVPLGSLASPQHSALSEKIPHTVFMRREVYFTESNSLDLKADYPIDDALALGLPRYEQITFKTSEILAVWPPKSFASNIEAEQTSDVFAKEQRHNQSHESDVAKIMRPKKGRGGKSYAAKDAPLIVEMAQLLAKGEASTPWEATLKVVGLAAGGGTVDAKRKRLLTGFQKRSGLNKLNTSERTE